MRYLCFNRLDDTLGFLVACNYYETPLGHHREKPFETAYIGANGPDACYAVRYPEEVEPLNAEPPLYRGGRFQEAAQPPGTPVHVNDLLRRMPLRRRREQPDYVPGLAIWWDPTRSTLSRAQASAALHRLWKNLPRGQDAPTRFFEATVQGQDQPGFVFTAEGLAEHFRRSDLKKLLPDGSALRVYLPAWRDRECFLYVEEGFEYPAAREYYALFDLQREAGVFLCDAIEDQRMFRSNGTEWFSGHWHRLAGTSFASSDQLLASVLVTGPAHDAKLDDRPPQIESVDVALRLRLAGGRRLGMSLEERAAQLERELERCRRQLAAREEEADRRYHVIFRFKQEGADKAMLPPALQSFLERPLSELGRYRYACQEIVGVRHHFLVGRFPSSRQEAQVVPGAQVFLQDVRWETGGLALFLPADYELNIDLSEEPMVQRLAEFLAEPRGAREYLLAEPADPRSEADNQPLQLLGLDFPAALDEVFGFLNDQRATVELGAEAAVRTLEIPLREHEIKAGADVREMHDQLMQRIRDAIGETEVEWEKMRQRCGELNVRATAVHLLVDETEEVYKQVPAEWQMFVDRVFALDETIAKAKVSIWGEWTKAKSQREDRLTAIEVAHRDFKPAIEIERMRMQKREEEVKAQAERCQAELEQLAKDQTALDRGKAELARRHEAARERSKALDTAREQAESEKAHLDAEIKRAEELKGDLTLRKNKIAEAREKLHGDEDKQRALEAEILALDLQLFSSSAKNAADREKRLQRLRESQERVIKELAEQAQRSRKHQELAPLVDRAKHCGDELKRALEDLR